MLSVNVADQLLDLLPVLDVLLDIGTCGDGKLNEDNLAHPLRVIR